MGQRLVAHGFDCEGMLSGWEVKSGRGGCIEVVATQRDDLSGRSILIIIEYSAIDNDVPREEVNIIKNLIVDKDNDLVGSSEQNISLLGPTIERHPQARAVWEKYPCLQQAIHLDGIVKNTGHLQHIITFFCSRRNKCMLLINISSIKIN